MGINFNDNIFINYLVNEGKRYSVLYRKVKKQLVL